MTITTRLRQDLHSLVRVQPLNGIFKAGDALTYRIEVELTDYGRPAEVSGSVKGYAIRSDGETFRFDGSLNGNVAAVSIPTDVCAVPGHISIAIKIAGITVAACTVNVN